MAKLMHKKVAGSTLVEVLIAMVIIMAVFSMAIALFGNVLKSGASVQKVSIKTQMEQLGNAIATKGYITENKLDIDSIAYELYEEETAVQDLSQLHIYARQYGKTVDSLNLLFQHKAKDAQD